MQADRIAPQRTPCRSRRDNSHAPVMAEEREGATGGRARVGDPPDYFKPALVAKSSTKDGKIPNSSVPTAEP
jgi:hypothetical protein